MELNLKLLKNFIELPGMEVADIRALLDDIGLEVKGIEGSGAATVFSIETLANRGDHLYALGVAREISARLLCGLKFPVMAASLGDRKSSVGVALNTDKCLRYALLELVFPNSIKLPADISAIVGESDKHSVVDLLNYVMLEMGQPMHAFDRDKLEGDIVVELSTKAEEVIGLDGVTYKVPPKSLLIKDQRKIIAVAGVIGCANTMVTPATSRVAIESASFDPVTVRLTARAMGLSTDASYFFERGCDVDLVQVALKRVVYLASGGSLKGDSAQLVGLQYVEGKPIELRQVQLRLAKVRQQLHSPRLDEAELVTRLKYLGFKSELKVDGKDKEWQVQVPSWRYWDIKNEEDLVEEFARAHGLNKIKLELPALCYDIPELDPAENLRAALEPALLGNGFNEVITKSYYSSREAMLLNELNPGVLKDHIQIKNALESSYSHLKSTNVWHLAQLAAKNLKRGLPTVKGFEFGRVFQRAQRQKAELEHERELLTLVIGGRWAKNEFRKEEPREALLAHAKGVVEALLTSVYITPEWTESKDPYLHPGCQIRANVGRVTVATLGLIHPSITAALDFDRDVVYVEASIEALVKLMNKGRTPVINDFPVIRRDVTLEIGERDLSAKAMAAINELKPAHMISTTVVDTFKKPGEAFNRVTYRITFQSDERTLESKEVDEAMEGMLAALAGRYGYRLAN